MDTNGLITTARARFDHETAKRVLREKYQAKMVFAYNGGMWRAGPELLTLLQAVPVDDPVVLLDLYNNPVRVDSNELQYLVMHRWQEQMNAWLIEFEEQNKKR
jgi:hypothetical protein